MFADNLIDSSTFPLVSAFLLGLATIISPCPFCSDITAVSYISKDVSSKKRVMRNGICYGIGKLVAYWGLSLVFLFGVQIRPIEEFFETYGEPALGPFLILCALVMAFMGYHEKHHHHTHNHERNYMSVVENKLPKGSGLGAFVLGFFGSLAFCPYSGVLYFGMLIPLSIAQPAAWGWTLPMMFGLATAIPVLIIAWTIAYGLGTISKVSDNIQRVEIWLRWLCITVFLGIGIYMCVEIFGGHHHHHHDHGHEHEHIEAYE